MLKMSLGNIEVYGLAAALEAADAATKSANVKLIGYEATDGLGMVAVKIEGEVLRLSSRRSRRPAAAGRISRVFARPLSSPGPASRNSSNASSTPTQRSGAEPRRVQDRSNRSPIRVTTSLRTLRLPNPRRQPSW